MFDKTLLKITAVLEGAAAKKAEEDAKAKAAQEAAAKKKAEDEAAAAAKQKQETEAAAKKKKDEGRYISSRTCWNPSLIPTPVYSHKCLVCLFMNLR